MIPHTLLVARLTLQKQPCRILDALLYPDEESHGLLAIDNPMVIAQGQIHHRADLDLTTKRHRTLLDLMHPKDTALWRVQNRSAQKLPINPPVRNSKHPAGELIELEFALSRFRRKTRDGAF